MTLYLISVSSALKNGTVCSVIFPKPAIDQDVNEDEPAKTAQLQWKQWEEERQEMAEILFSPSVHGIFSFSEYSKNVWHFLHVLWIDSGGIFSSVCHPEFCSSSSDACFLSWLYIVSTTTAVLSLSLNWVLLNYLG